MQAFALVCRYLSICVMNAYVREKYGVRTGREVRSYAKTLKNLARFKNHLVFSLRCKSANIIPHSLMVKPLVRTRRGVELARRTRMAFLKE